MIQKQAKGYFRMVALRKELIRTRIIVAGRKNVERNLFRSQRMGPE